MNSSQEPATVKHSSSELAFTKSDTPKASVKSTPIVAPQAKATSNSKVTADQTEVVPTPVDPTPTTPPVIFSASNEDYPGSGSFMLPVFSAPNGSWTVNNFDYTCDTGQVFLVVYAGVQAIFPTSYPVSGFSGTVGHLKVVVPPGQNCTWNVSVS